jgi:hypothetical protein
MLIYYIFSDGIVTSIIQIRTIAIFISRMVVRHKTRMCDSLQGHEIHVKFNEIPSVEPLVIKWRQTRK